jgi:hypothetical protein
VTKEPVVRELVAAAQRLSDAFAARDVAAALGCFAPGEISYVGSELGERARGRTAVADLLGTLFDRDEAYAWTVSELTAHAVAGGAYVSVEADGRAMADGGGGSEFPYRLCGLLEPVDEAWLWRSCHGSVPEV